MARSETTRYRINVQEPPNYDQKYECLLQFQYLIDNEGVYEFRYRSVTRKISEAAFLPDDIDKLGWKTFMKIGRDIEYRTYIDIDIKYGDTLVIVETVDNNNFRDLYWSQVEPALTTKKYRKQIYGLLEYYYDRQWRTEIPRNDLCRKMRFRARHNEDRHLSRDWRHGFAFNVFLRNVEREIDPDIKNPSV